MNDFNAPQNPNTGDIYEFEDAVRFATEWARLEEPVVRKVLVAKERYLDLAGISGCEEDEPLIRERDAFRHLLPEHPNELDDREIEYVKLTTGLDEDTVMEVFVGETAYADHLGIIEWPSDEERDRSLGISAFIKDSDDPAHDAEDEPMHEGHGEHWECVVPEAASFIPDHLANMPGVENLRMCVPSPFPSWATVTARAIPQAGALETLRLDGDKDGESDVISAFPVARDGAVFPLTLHRVRSWDVGCEGIVIASTKFGASVAYFDTAFLHPWNEWESDEEVEVQLAAFAYALAPAPVQVFQITKEEVIRAMKAAEDGVTPEEVTDLSPIEVRTEGMASFFPQKNGNPDDFEFQGPVASVDLLQAWGHPIYRLEVTVMRDAHGEEDVPFTIPVYVAEHNLPEGYRPRVGDDVRGQLWLQGTRAKLPFPIVCEG